MTNPPQGGDEPVRDGPGHGPGGQLDPDRHPTEPVPFVQRSQPPYGQYGQQLHGPPPQYGPAPYGQPAAPAKSRVVLIAGVTAGIVALVALGAVLALTMSSTVLDRNAVQQDVAAQFQEREGVAIDLECAEEMEVTSGATYECTGTTSDEEDVTLEVTITDEETAAYTWTEP